MTFKMLDRSCEPKGPTAPPILALGGPERESAPAVTEADGEPASLAIPRRRHVLSTVAEFYAEPLRHAVAVLAASLARKQRGAIPAFLFSSGQSQPGGNTRPEPEMAAWTMAAMWATAVAARVLPCSASLADAENWFFGSQLPGRLTGVVSASALRKAETALQTQADPSAYIDLLPYILDPHGPGSRLSVRRDPTTRRARTRKRSEGVFYTPADIAEYMANACLEGLILDGLPSIFDPACGTGVFLRAGLKALRRLHPNVNPFTLGAECLYGTDIDPWAPDAAAFVLLADILTGLPDGMPPLKAWQQLRVNFACVDTLLIDPPERRPANGESAAMRRPMDAEQMRHMRIAISRLFPSLRDGATVILGNPPYADLGTRSDLAGLENSFESIAAKRDSGAEIYLAFVEQVIRLTGGESRAGALVLPLSIACNIGPQFAVVRKLIARTPGRWRFAFFDREPHALFGEDVKTRNAIMLWSQAPSDSRAVIATGPLRKWKGDDRAAMFQGLRFTVINEDIRGGIPKIEGECQKAAISTMSARWSRLEDAVQSVGRTTLSAAPDADTRTVFVGPTAYNFLNVFLVPQRCILQSTQELSEHPLHAIHCASLDDAMAVFAILSSRLAYWWWHAHGDGFHVSRRFLARLPFGAEALAPPAGPKLAACGAELWLAIRDQPIISLNRGRTSLGFTPNGHDGIRRKVDQLLAALAGLDPDFVIELQQFTARSVSATLHETKATRTNRKEGT